MLSDGATLTRQSELARRRRLIAWGTLALERFANALLTSIEGAGCGHTFSPWEKVPRSGG